MDSNDENYIKTIHERCDNLIPRFQKLKECVKTKQINLNNKFKDNFIQLAKCEDILKWQIKHLHEHHGTLDTLIKQSFEDTLNEINWRMKELETELRVKKIF